MAFSFANLSFIINFKQLSSSSIINLFVITLWGQVMQEIVVEERQESCSTVCKIVKVKIFRRRIVGALQAGEIVGFDCASLSPSCESKCSYKLLMDDY